jgi:hypothetical protein
MTQVFSFLIGIFGEALVLKFVSRIQYWWETQMSEEMKNKADLIYDQLFPDSESLGKPEPPDEL